MMEVVSNQSSLLANGNRRVEMEQTMGKDSCIINSPHVLKYLKEEQEHLTRELQFYEVVSHVLEKIEKECQDEMAEEEKGLWPEVSLLDMKQYLKPKVHSSGVSEHSPIFILEAVSTKLGRSFHSADVFDLRQLAACTDAKLDEVVMKGKNILKADLEFAVQDAKSVMRIIVTEKEQQKGAWNNWSNLAEMNIKDNTQKLAKFVWQLNPKGLVDVLTRSNSTDDDDEDSFFNI